LNQIALCLVAAQLVGDFLLQTAAMVRNKKRLSVLLGHCAVLAGLSYLLCGLWTRWEVPVVILFSHALIDFVKTKSGKNTPASFLIDQGAHFAVIGALTVFITAAVGAESYWTGLLGPWYLKSLILLSGATASIKAGGYLIGTAVRPIQEQLLAHRKKAGTDFTGFETGGMLIGQLERGLILLLTLTGQATGIGFLIAAKSILRFGDAQDPRHRIEGEYIIIGTLMSFGWGILIAYITLYFYQLV
jgi:hypothetical protein